MAVPLGIATKNAVAAARDYLDRFDTATYANGIVGSPCKPQLMKPGIDMVSEALRKAHVFPGRAVLIEDFASNTEVHTLLGCAQVATQKTRPPP